MKPGPASPPDRYNRHRLIDGFDQDRLARTDVIVVGAGAVGNEALKNLALLGVGKIEIHDFDLIEAHNLTRSILFNERQIGKSKAEAAADACRQIDPNLQAQAFHGDFRDHLTVDRVRAADAVLCCVDNHEARIHLNRLCLLARTPLLNAAIDSREVSAEIYPHSVDSASACYECWIPAAIYAGIRERYSCGGLRKASIEQRRIPTTTLTSSIAGAYLVSLLLQHVCRMPSRRTAAMQARARLTTLTSDERAILHNPACPACQIYGAATPLVLTCRPHGVEVPPVPGNQEEPVLLLSEDLITGWTSDGCGTSEPLLAPARKYDASLLWCPGCGTTSRKIQILSRSTPSELAAIAGGRPLPLRFLYAPSARPPIVLSFPACTDASASPPFHPTSNPPTEQTTTP